MKNTGRVYDQLEHGVTFEVILYSVVLKVRRPSLLSEIMGEIEIKAVSTSLYIKYRYLT